MANGYKGEVAFPGVPVTGFEQGGVILLDFNALATLEDELPDLLQGELGLEALQSPKVMRAVWRVAMEERHGAVDDRTAGRIIHHVGVEASAQLLEKAFKLSFPEAAKDGSADPSQGAQSAPGTSSAVTASGSKSDSKRTCSGGKPRARSA